MKLLSVGYPPREYSIRERERTRGARFWHQSWSVIASCLASITASFDEQKVALISRRLLPDYESVHFYRLRLNPNWFRLHGPSTDGFITISVRLLVISEPAVRCELIEQLPNIAMLCHEDKDRLHHLVADNLLPLVLKFLGDTDNQVCKSSQESLMVLIEQGLIDLNTVEDKVCPYILMLTDLDSLVEFHTGAVAVCKSSQESLMVLIEQGLIDLNTVEDKVCPYILMLTDLDSLVEFHTGAVATVVWHGVATAPRGVKCVAVVGSRPYERHGSITASFDEQKVIPPFSPSERNMRSQLIASVRRDINVAALKDFTLASFDERHAWHYPSRRMELPQSSPNRHIGLLMGKIAPLIGRKSAENLFLEKFALMCASPVFYVRKACAANFGEFCTVVSVESIENTLLPRFVDLCKDEIWGVRKSCAEVFMSVSCACTMEMRKSTLASLSANLLSDPSRWVRMSAFKTLGPFISTFADPRVTGLTYNRVGELTLSNPDSKEYKNILSRLTSSQISDSELAWVIVDSKSNMEESDLLTDVAEVKTTVENSDLFIASLESRQPKKTLSEQSVLVDGDGDTTSSLSAEFEQQQENLQSDKVVETYDVKSCEAVIYNVDSAIVEEMEGGSVDTRTCGGGERGESHKSPVAPERNEASQLHVSETAGCLQIHVGAGLDYFNTFQYWRVPIPELELNIRLTAEGKPSTVHIKAKVTDEASQRTYASELSVDMDIDSELDKLATKLENWPVSEDCPLLREAQICTSSVATVSGNDTITNVVESNMQKAVVMIRPDGKINTSVKQTKFKLFNPSQDMCPDTRPVNRPLNNHRDTSWAISNMSPPASKDEVIGVRVPLKNLSSELASGQEPQSPGASVTQHIVPQMLIDHYVSMTHPWQSQKTDAEIAYHCAFSLPAVALTLGRENWFLLKDTYETLALDLQWKVRRTVASSIHELAVILGEDLATKDLVHIYNGFIKDLDEVRIGALKHLADFLKLVRPSERNSFLPRLTEFLLTDNEWNWRFREELAEQLLMTVGLFSPMEVRKHLTPLAIALLMDKVAAVRHIALYLVTQLVHHVSIDTVLMRGLLAELAEQFAHSKRWSRRQTFALLCSRLVSEHVLPEKHFARDILPHLLDLSWDRVPNVRLAVARSLSQDILAQKYFSSGESPHHELIMPVLKRLQVDQDRDVRYFAVVRPRLMEVVRERSVGATARRFLSGCQTRKVEAMGLKFVGSMLAVMRNEDIRERVKALSQTPMSVVHKKLMLQYQIALGTESLSFQPKLLHVSACQYDAIIRL
uniref:Serine/threonine-protein phosphatase 4 regulatory subunit 1 n=1 Tax=Timema cristinae TaxID=61476 RepID=A0A7R9GP37_TIMCR|nr:unnamed protein product [Timema cristinae]